MPNLTAHITHLLECSEERCILRFEQLNATVTAKLSKKEATQQGYLYGFEDALQLLQAMLEEGIGLPKRREA